MQFIYGRWVFRLSKGCRATDAKILLKECLQFINDTLLFLGSATTAKARNRRHDFIDVCTGGFDFTITESILQEFTGVLRL